MDSCEAAGFFGFLWCHHHRHHHHQHTRSAQLSVFLKARLRIEFYVFLHATRHRRAVQWAERPSRAAPCDGGLVGDNQVANCVVRPPPPPVALVSTWRQTAPQRHLREIESNHQAAQRQIQRGRRRTLATACTSELLLELMLLLELLLLELLLLELLLLELLLLETDHEERELPRRSVRLGARTAQPSTHVAYFHRIRNFQ